MRYTASVTWKEIKQQRIDEALGLQGKEQQMGKSQHLYQRTVSYWFDSDQAAINFGERMELPEGAVGAIVHDDLTLVDYIKVEDDQ